MRHLTLNITLKLLQNLKINFILQNFYGKKVYFIIKSVLNLNLIKKWRKSGEISTQKKTIKKSKIPQ